jgi:5-methylcytosine-specific restriction endonuclease McrA
MWRKRKNSMNVSYIGEIALRTDDVPSAVRDSVLERDDYQCQRCGSYDNLHLHHVVPRSLVFDETKHSPNNLVTVCFWCHRAIHDGKVLVRRIEDTWYFGSYPRMPGRKV